MKTALLLLGLLSFSSVTLAGYDCTMGEVSYHGYNFETRQDTEADGRLLPIRTNQALFSLFGNKYGGDGYSNFALPKIDPIKTANGEEIKAYICTEGIYPARK
jgi:microcystin-dependent protein